MHRNLIAIAIVGMTAAVPASAVEERSAAWFADHPKERFEGNRCGGITYKFCARVEMMLSVAD